MKWLRKSCGRCGSDLTSEALRLGEPAAVAAHKETCTGKEDRFDAFNEACLRWAKAWRAFNRSWKPGDAIEQAERFKRLHDASASLERLIKEGKHNP